MRSLMYVPGNRQRMIDRALGLGEYAAGPLDVAILDLEDGTPPGEKENGRETVAASLGRRSQGGGGPHRWARVNALASNLTDLDLAAVVRPGVEAVVVPKVEDPRDVTSVVAILDALEPKAGLAAGAVRVVPMIESALSLLNVFAIATSSRRVLGVIFGAEDYSLDLGLPAVREAEALELLYARSAVANAAAAANVAAFDGIYAVLQDPEGLRRDSLRGRRLGFTGKTAIHPSHIDAINEVFSPTAEELREARAIVEAFDAAIARGEGAVTLGGKMLDRPIVERARRLAASQE